MINQLWVAIGPILISLVAVFVTSLICMIIISRLPNHLQNFGKRLSSLIVAIVFVFTLWVSSGMIGSVY